jgi:hypothetical protein
MVTHTSSVLALLCTAVVATAQNGPSTSSAPAPLALDAVNSALAGSAPVSSGRTEALRIKIEELQQQPDYTLRGMFQQAHGDYMLKREHYNPMIKLSAKTMPNYSIKGEPGSFDLLQFTGDMDLQFMVSPDAYIVAGAYFDERRYQAHNMPSFEDENLYGVGGKLGFGMFFSNDVLFEASSNPGAWSDLDGTLNNKDFDYPSKVLLTIRTADNFFFKAGVRYNQIFKEATVLPYLGFSVMIGDGFRIDLLAPEMLEASWWPTSQFGLSFGTQITGAQYHVRTSQATGSEQADVNVQEVVVYGGATWRFSDYLSLGARAGMTVAGDYHLTTGQAGLNVQEGTLETGMFVDITFGVDF